MLQRLSNCQASDVSLQPGSSSGFCCGQALLKDVSFERAARCRPTAVPSATTAPPPTIHAAVRATDAEAEAPAGRSWTRVGAGVAGGAAVAGGGFAGTTTE